MAELEAAVEQSMGHGYAEDEYDHDDGGGYEDDHQWASSSNNKPNRIIVYENSDRPVDEVDLALEYGADQRDEGARLRDILQAMYVGLSGERGLQFHIHALFPPIRIFTLPVTLIPTLPHAHTDT